MVGDFVLVRSTGIPVYNFSCVIDDHLMKISHVFRSEEHLSNTLRQLMIYEALGWKPPLWAHLSIILGKDRKKLSKRHGATSCDDFRKRGYLPEAINNALSLLGWSHPEGKEKLSLSELTKSFSLERLHSSAAVFDQDKLNWLNKEHLWNASMENQTLFRDKINPYLLEKGLTLDQKTLHQTVDILKKITVTLEDVTEVVKIMSSDHFRIDQEDSMTKEVLSWQSTKEVIQSWVDCLSSEEVFMTEEEFSEIQKKIQKDCDVKGKKLFMPLRLSILGKPQGLEIKQIVPILSKKLLKKKGNYVLTHYLQ